MNASQDPWERPKYLELLYQARAKSGKTWKRVDAEAQVEKPTREQWFNGRTKDPPFTGVVRLADAIGVDLERLAEAVRGEEATAARATLEERVAMLQTRLDQHPTFAREEQEHAAQRAAALRSLAAVKDLSRQAEGRPDAEGDARDPG